MKLPVRVVAQGRYIGRILAEVQVQNEHGYSTAYHIQFQREVEPRSGWFLARDIQGSLAWGDVL